MKRLVSRRPSPALIISILALVVAMAGTGYAATKLPKNSVGAKQIKKNAVTTAKIKKNAVTKAKIKKNSVTGTAVKNQSLTGADIDLAKLGTVPSASSATTAGSANTANTATTANTANTANVANRLSALEPTHIIGSPGEPPFQGGAGNLPYGEAGFNVTPAGFYKDHEGIVHLEGVVKPPTGGELPVIFSLPPGYRPATKSLRIFGSPEEGVPLFILGSGVSIEGVALDGDVIALGAGEEMPVVLEGIEFRAGS